MPNRAGDWLAQAERDLQHAQQYHDAGVYEWGCFAAPARRGGTAPCPCDPCIRP